MCGRFALKEDPKRFAEYFDLTGDFDLSPSRNIAPSSRICSITADEEGSRHLQKMRWGLIPSWAKDATIGSKLTRHGARPLQRSLHSEQPSRTAAASFPPLDSTNGKPKRVSEAQQPRFDGQRKSASVEGRV